MAKSQMLVDKNYTQITLAFMEKASLCSVASFSNKAKKENVG